MTTTRRWTVVGGAGFIGGHVVDRLLSWPETESVTVYDNFSSGRDWHLAGHESDARLAIVRADVKDLARLAKAFAGIDAVIHLASNPDIARALHDPTVDFDEGTLLTQHVVEACRLASVQLLLYASGSGVYGDLGHVDAQEDMGPLSPISTYGASKLAGEALICAYCHMFGLSGRTFRFGNVVGARQTHGVGYDFVRHLLRDPTRLTILGDGSQSKSYVYVTDIVDALLGTASDGSEPYAVYNVATGDYVTVTEIADIVVRCMELEPSSVVYEYTGGRRGWKGDVPVVRMNTERIRSTGWRPTRGSAQAHIDAAQAMIAEVRQGCT